MNTELSAEQQIRLKIVELLIESGKIELHGQFEEKAKCLSEFVITGTMPELVATSSK